MHHSSMPKFSLEKGGYGWKDVWGLGRNKNWVKQQDLKKKKKWWMEWNDQNTSWLPGYIGLGRTRRYGNGR